MRLLAILLLCITPLTTSAAQDTESLLRKAKDQLEQGTDGGDAAAIQKARATFERAAQDKEHAALAHYYAALAEQRTVNLLLGADDDEASDHLDAAIDHAQKVEESRPDWSEVHVLLANMYGMKSGMNPLMAIIYGPRADGALSKAESLNPKNPRVALVDGISLYHKPGMFGGSKEKALERLEEAVALFESAPAAALLEPSWGHEEAYAWIGIIHMENKDGAEARRAFEKALAVNPDYGWVKNALLPQVQ